MLGIMFWLAFGMAVGWTAVILRSARKPGDISVCIIIGGLGGMAGGFVGGLLDPASAGYRTATTDIVFAVFGATAFVYVAGLVQGFIAQRHGR